MRNKWFKWLFVKEFSLVQTGFLFAWVDLINKDALWVLYGVPIAFFISVMTVRKGDE